MKISREEFKELVQLYRDSYIKDIEATPYLDDEFLGSLIYPVYEWISKCIGMVSEDGMQDMLQELIFSGKVPVNVKWTELPDGELECSYDETNNLDVIYDEYLS